MPGEEIKRHCSGRLDYAIRAIVVLWRTLLEATVSSLEESEIDARLASALSHQRLGGQEGTTVQCLGENLLREYSLWSGQSKRDLIGAFDLFPFVRDLLYREALPHDLSYLAARELRGILGIRLGADLMESVQLYTAAIVDGKDNLVGSAPADILLTLLKRSQERYERTGNARTLISPEIYLAIVAALGWIAPKCRGQLTVHLDRFQVEALIGRLFSLPTQIHGFDDMLGGWGLLLPDLQRRDDDTYVAQPIGSRTVLVTGPYGSGKSTLTYEVALEIARKGGVALVVAAEQTTEECLYALEALGPGRGSTDLRVVKDIRDAIPVLMKTYDGQGALMFLASAGRDDNFLKVAQDRLAWMRNYPLRLLIIDPINSALGLPDTFRKRRHLLALFDEAKLHGINIWMTTERNSEVILNPSFEENIADTVFHMSVDSQHGYPRRAIEVRKSRLQREEPGRHAFLLSGGEGIRIYPSSAAVERRFELPVASNRPQDAVTLGVPGIDRILGDGAVFRHDLIAFDGPQGSSRTLAGIHFLFGGEKRGRSKSLFVADTDESKMLSLVELITTQRGAQTAAGLQTEIALQPILPGWVEPGQILHWIERAIEKADRDGTPIDRILLADVSRWTTSMPLLGEDPAFGSALLGLLRASGATCVLLTGDIPNQARAGLTDLITGNADCVIQFYSLEFRGQTRRFVRALRSHNMGHRGDSFELVMDRDGMRVEPYGALLRRDGTGSVHCINIRLFLHADTPRHQHSNELLAQAMQTSVAGNAVIEDQWTHYDPAMLRLSASSGVDELQIIQLDEFQLPSAQDPDTARLFFARACSDWLPEYLSRFAQRVRIGDQCIAVPFYENISLLAIHNDRFGERIPDSTSPAECWDIVRSRSLEWERGGKGPFFSCPLASRETLETYNCLYFEILQAYSPNLPEQDCQLEAWIRSIPAKEAAYVFRDICHLSHDYEFQYLPRPSMRSNPKNRDFSDIPDERAKARYRDFSDIAGGGDYSPAMWRHWYNTLSQMLWELPPEERLKIEVRPLFGDVSTAGEWYLAIPAYSAAPEVGWQIIDSLTSPDRELKRLHRGIGLPTRKAFYDQADVPVEKDTIASPFYHLSRRELRKLVVHAFRRSRFSCYVRMSDTIAAHLQRILEIPVLLSQNSHHIKNEIDTILIHLADSIRYIQTREICKNCQSSKQFRDQAPRA